MFSNVLLRKEHVLPHHILNVLCEQYFDINSLLFILFYALKTSILKIGPWGKNKNEGTKSHIRTKAHVNKSYCFPWTLIRWASCSREEREQQKRRSLKEEREGKEVPGTEPGGCGHHPWRVFSSLAGPASEREGREGLLTQHNKQTPTFFVQSHWRLRMSQPPGGCLLKIQIRRPQVVRGHLYF